MIISNPIVVIDDYLIDHMYEPIASWTHTWFGCTNFVLARVLSICSLILSQLKLHSEPLSSRARTSYLSMMVLLTVIVVLRSFAAERQLKKSEEGQCANEERLDPIMLIVRVSLFLAMLQTVFYFLFRGQAMWQALYEISITSTYFFLACVSRPRQRGRVLNLLFAGSSA